MSNFNLLHTTGYDVAIMRSNNEKVDKKEEIHIWISSRDYENSNMMILLGYIIIRSSRMEKCPNKSIYYLS